MFALVLTQGSDKMLKVKDFFAGLLGVCFMVSANAVELYGMADVNVTSDTAAAAKNMAEPCYL